MACLPVPLPYYYYLRPLKVDGYTQDYWGQGRAARDAVTPRDQLIEVEFREGARSVFDDPRYLGQDGPTGGFRTYALP